MLSFRRFPLVGSPRPERPTDTKEARTHLRWKLLVIASLIAAVAGAAGSLSLVNAPPALVKMPLKFSAKIAFIEFFPLVTSCLASIFVYRHTARRRKTQALIAVLLSLFLFQALLYFFLRLPPIVFTGD
jgi:hypothetical protein